MCTLSCLSIAYKENIFSLQHLIKKSEADIFFHACASDTEHCKLLSAGQREGELCLALCLNYSPMLAANLFQLPKPLFSYIQSLVTETISSADLWQ